MKQLTAIQISILLSLEAKDERVRYTAQKSDCKILWDMRLITSHLVEGFILSKSGQEIVNKILSLCNPIVLELSESQYNK